jgi:hypothetical protein
VRFADISREAYGVLVAHFGFGIDSVGTIHDARGAVTFETHPVPGPPGAFRPLADADRAALLTALEQFIAGAPPPADPLWQELLRDLQAAPAYPVEPAPGHPILLRKDEGGIAGVNDLLTAAVDVVRVDGRQGQTERPTTAAERAALRDAFQRLQPFITVRQDNPGGPDNLVRVLVLASAGTTAATPADAEALLQLSDQLRSG